MVSLGLLMGIAAFVLMGVLIWAFGGNNSNDG